jgi:hypothetical protein
MMKDEPVRALGAMRATPPSRVRADLNLLARTPPADHSLQLLALAFGLPPPPTDVRDAAAQVMAELIDELGPVPDPRARRSALEDLLQPLVDAAVAACREANDEHDQAAMALRRLRDARAGQADRRLLGRLESGTERLMVRAAELLIVAHIRSEEARGAARAVSLARRNKRSACVIARPHVASLPNQVSGRP